MVLGDFVAYRVEFQSGLIALIVCIECGELLSLIVEKIVIL